MTPTPTDIEAAITEDGITLARHTLDRAGTISIALALLGCAASYLFDQLPPDERADVQANWLAAFRDHPNA